MLVENFKRPWTKFLTEPYFQFIVATKKKKRNTLLIFSLSQLAVATTNLCANYFSASFRLPQTWIEGWFDVYRNFVCMFPPLHNDNAFLRPRCFPQFFFLLFSSSLYWFFSFNFGLRKHHHAGVEGLVVFLQGFVLIFLTLLFVLKNWKAPILFWKTSLFFLPNLKITL
jgi:hypothetical protein